MVYDLMEDSPSPSFYSNIPKKENKPPAPQFFNADNTFYTSSSVSPIKEWWERERELQKKGLRNEIDRNEIAAALRGIKNKWYDKCLSRKQEFIDLLENENDTKWKEILG